MTSSGTYDFEISNGEVVLAAYERLKIFAPEIVQKHMSTARRELKADNDNLRACQDSWKCRLFGSR